MVPPPHKKGAKTNMIKTRSIAPPLFIVALLTLLIQAPVFAGIYKWVDKGGQVHYSDLPRVENAEEVNIRTNETTQTRKIPLKSEEEIAAEEKRKKEAEAKKAQKPKIPASEKRRLCKQARHELEVINSRGRLREINAKGEYIYLPEEERQKRISRAKKDIRKYCR